MNIIYSTSSGVIGAIGKIKSEKEYQVLQAIEEAMVAVYTSPFLLSVDYQGCRTPLSH